MLSDGFAAVLWFADHFWQEMPPALSKERMLPGLSSKALVVDGPRRNDRKAPEVELPIEGPKVVVPKVDGQEFGCESSVVVDAKGGPVGRPGDNDVVVCDVGVVCW